MGAPAPGSEEEAESRRRVGAGPFSAGKCQVHDETPGQYDGAAVFDAQGEPFCLIASDNCVGGDLAAAKARATRIAEALNRTVFRDHERKLTTTEYERRAGVVVGHDFVYPAKRRDP